MQSSRGSRFGLNTKKETAMKNSTILIALGKDSGMGDLARQLETIRSIPARVVALVVAEMPKFPYYTLGVPAYGTIDALPEWQETLAQNTEALKARQQEIEALLQQHDVSGEVAVIAGEPDQISDAIARRAMLCDIVLVSDDLRGSDRLFRQVVHGVLFQSPVGVLLNDPRAETLQRPDRVLVAWNTQLHAARALHQTLPLLRKAQEVVIATVDPVMSESRSGEDPGVDVAKWLTHHGCTVTVQQYPSGGRETGHCLLDRAKEAGSDLIVMGAYGHSRTREALFGGTTRTLLEQTEQAVFLAH